MSVAEMKLVVIEKISRSEDEELIRRIMNMLEAPKPSPDIKHMYEEARSTYGETLKKLAE